MFLADHVPFGGVGHSGTGAYHGKTGFEEFSHKKPVYATKQMLESVNTLVALHILYHTTILHRTMFTIPY